MRYAAIMVNVDDDESSSQRIKLAAHLSVRFQCTLIGIAARMPRPAPLQEGDVVGDGGAYYYQIEAVNKWLEQQGNAFREIATPIQSKLEWRCAADFPLRFLTTQARAADLVIIARDSFREDPYYSLDSAAALLKMGRPVLAVPPGVDALQAERIVVAWKDAREARRAVREALPLLREAKEVFLIEASDEDSGSPAQKHVDDVCEYLVRHDVIVAAKVIEHVETTVAAELIRAAQDRQADLIVAGAYGHSRLGEWIFGGVTRELLKSSPICCFFSH